MQQRALHASGLAVAFLLIGGVWVSAVRLLPGGLPRSLFMVALCLTFVSIFVTLLVMRVRSLLGGGHRLWVDLLMVLAEVLLLIASFAAVYNALGIQDNSGPEPRMVHNFFLSSYYSVVTFTTLGYGDFYPMGIGRALAAIEALVGYVVLGLLASTAASIISPHQPAGTVRTPGGNESEASAEEEGEADSSDPPDDRRTRDATR